MKHLKKFEIYTSKEETNINNILDKINSEGIDSLTKKELEILNNNGIDPQEKNDDESYNDDEDAYYKISDLEDLVQSEENLEEFEPDWLLRRQKARELYNININNSNDILEHYNKIINYYDDDKNPPIFKAKIIKIFLDEIENILQNDADKKMKDIATKIYDILTFKLDNIYK